MASPTTQKSPIPYEEKADAAMELGPEEQELALRRWRQMKLVVLMFTASDL